MTRSSAPRISGWRDGERRVDAGGNAADGGKLGRHLLGHELAAKAGLGALGDIDLKPVGALHVVDVPAKPAAEALEDQLFGSAPLGIRHAAFAGILGNLGKRRGHADRPLGGGRQRAIGHGRDHHRHGELQGLAPLMPPTLGIHLDLVDDIRLDRLRHDLLAEGQVRHMRQGARAAIAADPVAADLRLDIDVFLDLGIPVIGLAGKGMERDRAHLRLRGAVAQLLAGIVDLLEGALERDLMGIEKAHDVVEFGAGHVGHLRIGAERIDLARHIDVAGRHILADPSRRNCRR